MSENTIFLIQEQANGTFQVSRHWFEEDLPLLGLDSKEGLTLREATTYCDSKHAEYGYQIVWFKEEVEDDS